MLVDNYTDLHYAAREGDLLSTFKYLNTQGYPIHFVAKNGLCAFSLAIIHRQEAVIKLFLEYLDVIEQEDIVRIIDKELVDIFFIVWFRFKFQINYEIICALITTNNPHFFNFLINEHPDFKFYLNPTLETPYMIAMCFGNQLAIDYFKAHSQDHIAKVVFFSKKLIKNNYHYIHFLIQEKVHIIIDGNPNMDPLVLFIKYYGLSLTHLLLIEGYQYRSAYFHAVQSKDVWLLDSLHKLVPHCINRTDSIGNTPFILSQSSFISRHLIKLGANPYLQNKLGETALFTAAKKANIHLVSFLLIHIKLSKRHHNLFLQKPIQLIPYSTSRYAKLYQMLF